MNQEIPDLYLKYEKIKDNFKLNYFNHDQLIGKEKIIRSMDTNQKTLKEVVNSLKNIYSNVIVYWNSCNFYSIAASNSKSNLNDFLGIMPEQYSPFVINGNNIFGY